MVTVCTSCFNIETIRVFSQGAFMYLGVFGGVGVNIRMNVGKQDETILKWTHQAQDRDR
jgi:hypothetical protein